MRIAIEENGEGMEFDKKKVKQIAWLIVFTMVVYTAVINYDKLFGMLGALWNLLFPFALGAAFAFFLNLPMRGIERWLKKLCNLCTNGKVKKVLDKFVRPVSLLLAFCCVIAVISIVVGVVAPQLVRTIESIGASLMAWLPNAQQQLEAMFSDNPEIERYIGEISIDWDSVFTSARNFAVNGATNVLTHLFSATVGIISGITTFVIAVVFACYILVQKEKLASQIQRVLNVSFKPHVVEKINYVASLTHRTFCSFITGQCLEACILGSLFFICMLIFRLPYAMLISVLIAFMALIPIVGAFIGCIVGALLILIVDPFKALFFVVMFLILQQIEGNLIYPHVVGSSVGLPSMWVLMAITIGGSLMGIAGMLICIPIASVLYSLIGKWVREREEKREKEERDDRIQV